ncbi:head-tail connector protein [Aureimonas pseudogalii]|uniref:Putative phiE125 gp8 family phage protein n=1 Tax=Aureimonas pseudogalii TaxID=1744844 RepID=A0A7W6H438_9HYPH|nr:phage head-tail connector protein [Aureimonas pseudogalii]MBB3996574.1 putative phiE125 gp8 family phage protein [Aureimonas pseudogalii]
MIWMETETGAAEPVGLAEAKGFLRLEHDGEDALVTRLIAAAREAVEAETGLVLRVARARLALEPPAGGGRIELSRRPVRRVVAAEAFDVAGEAMTIDPAGIAVRNEPLGASLRLPAMAAPNGLELDLELGLDPAAVPEGVRQAILRLVAAAFETRAAVPAAMQPAVMPPFVRGLLAPLRRVRL